MTSKKAKYEILKTLGEGGYGRALLVRDRKDRTQYVMKEVRLTALKQKDRDEALREAKVLASLRNPNIVQYKESFQERGNFYIVMEFADGGDLAQKIEKRGKKLFSEAEIMHDFIQIALALKYCHDRKILHRDLKAQNVFLMKDGTVKLGDFGIARVLENTFQLCQTQIGTPYYLSPEICEGRKYNSKTDVWSLGCILYELCTLKHPFDAANMNGLLMVIIRGRYQPISQSYSLNLRNLLAKLLTKDPAKRPSINQILGLPWIKDQLGKFLDQTLLEYEMGHTILHGRKPLAQPTIVLSKDSAEKPKEEKKEPRVDSAAAQPVKRLPKTPVQSRRPGVPRSPLQQKREQPPTPPKLSAEEEKKLKRQQEIAKFKRMAEEREQQKRMQEMKRIREEERKREEEKQEEDRKAAELRREEEMKAAQEKMREAAFEARKKREIAALKEFVAEREKQKERKQEADKKKQEAEAKVKMLEEKKQRLREEEAKRKAELEEKRKKREEEEQRKEKEREELKQKRLREIQEKRKLESRERNSRLKKQREERLEKSKKAREHAEEEEKAELLRLQEEDEKEQARKAELLRIQEEERKREEEKKAELLRIQEEEKERARKALEESRGGFDGLKSPVYIEEPVPVDDDIDDNILDTVRDSFVKKVSNGLPTWARQKEQMRVALEQEDYTVCPAWDDRKPSVVEKDDSDEATEKLMLPPSNRRKIQIKTPSDDRKQIFEENKHEREQNKLKARGEKSEKRAKLTVNDGIYSRPIEELSNEERHALFKQQKEERKRNQEKISGEPSPGKPRAVTPRMRILDKNTLKNMAQESSDSEIEDDMMDHFANQHNLAESIRQAMDLPMYEDGHEAENGFEDDDDDDTVQRFPVAHNDDTRQYRADEIRGYLERKIGRETLLKVFDEIRASEFEDHVETPVSNGLPPDILCAIHQLMALEM